jgi:protoporphyrinogen/coproporphyrinogen III oxidase
MALEYALPARRGDEDESLASFVQRRFGGEVYARLVEPLMAGIYAGDGDQLSLAATFPQLRAMERQHGSLLRAIKAARRGQAGVARPGFLTPELGMGQLVDAIKASLQRTTVVTGSRVLAIERDSARYTISTSTDQLGADSVVLAVPAYAAGQLLQPIDAELSDLLSTIPYVSTATISLAFRRDDMPRPLDGYGYIVPRAEGRPALACTWVSSKFAHRAPPGHALLRVFVGRAGQGDFTVRSDDELLEIARRELRDVLGVTASPLFSRIFRWDRAMPQYTLGHLERVRRIAECLHAHPGLFLAGSAYRGIGVPDCISTGEDAAGRVAAHVRSIAVSSP